MATERNRRGRKRKQARRHANGRLAHVRPDDRLLAAQQPHRRHLPEAARMSERAVTELGCLSLLQPPIITEVQYLAGEHFNRTTELYLTTVAGPRRLRDCGRSNGSCLPETCERDNCLCWRRTKDFNELLQVLIRVGDANEVMRVCVFGEQLTDAKALRVGLSALATHLRLGKN